MERKCDVCGHETNYLETGYGQYEGKMLCKMCDSRIYELDVVTSELYSIKNQKKFLVRAAQRCIALIDEEVSKGNCTEAYSLIRNTLNNELDKLRSS